MKVLPMFEKIILRIIQTVKDFFIEIYYAELDHMDNFYRQYR